MDTHCQQKVSDDRECMQPTMHSRVFDIWGDVAGMDNEASSEIAGEGNKIDDSAGIIEGTLWGNSAGAGIEVTS